MFICYWFNISYALGYINGYCYTKQKSTGNYLISNNQGNLNISCPRTMFCEIVYNILLEELKS